jgi:hypothetical protein
MKTTIVLANDQAFQAFYIDENAKSWKDKIVFIDPIFEQESPGVIALKSLRLNNLFGAVLTAPVSNLKAFQEKMKKMDNEEKLGKETPHNIMAEILKVAEDFGIEASYLQLGQKPVSAEVLPLDMVEYVGIGYYLHTPENLEKFYHKTLSSDGPREPVLVKKGSFWASKLEALESVRKPDQVIIAVDSLLIPLLDAGDKYQQLLFEKTKNKDYHLIAKEDRKISIVGKDYQMGKGWYLKGELPKEPLKVTSSFVPDLSAEKHVWTPFLVHQKISSVVEEVNKSMPKGVFLQCTKEIEDDVPVVRVLKGPKDPYTAERIGSFAFYSTQRGLEWFKKQGMQETNFVPNSGMVYVTYYNDEERKEKFLFELSLEQSTLEWSTKILESFNLPKHSVVASITSLEEAIDEFKSHSDHYVGYLKIKTPDQERELVEELEKATSSEIYRCVSVEDLESFLKDLPSRGTGIYWSGNRDKAVCYWGDSDEYVILTAEADNSSIDWLRTVELSMNPKYAGEEEIRLLPGKNIKVLEIEHFYKKKAVPSQIIKYNKNVSTGHDTYETHPQKASAGKEFLEDFNFVTAALEPSNINPDGIHLWKSLEKSIKSKYGSLAKKDLLSLININYQKEALKKGISPFIVDPVLDSSQFRHLFKSRFKSLNESLSLIESDLKDSGLIKKPFKWKFSSIKSYDKFFITLQKKWDLSSSISQLQKALSVRHKFQDVQSKVFSFVKLLTPGVTVTITIDPVNSEVDVYGSIYFNQDDIYCVFGIDNSIKGLTWFVKEWLSSGKLPYISQKSPGPSFNSAEAILRKKYREDSHREEWALLSKKGDRVLKWFGPRKPSTEEVSKEEKRVQFFKHLNK